MNCALKRDELNRKFNKFSDKKMIFFQYVSYYFLKIAGIKV